LGRRFCEGFAEALRVPSSRKEGGSMGQYVIEFASPTVEAIFNVIESLVRPTQVVHTLSSAERTMLTYRELSGNLSETLARLKDGSICSVSVHPTGEIRYGLITCPYFNGQTLSLWMGTN
jgi:hypothetical protein